MMNNESSHLYGQQNPELVTSSQEQRRLYSVNSGIHNTSNSNSNISVLSFSDGFVMNVISFIQGYQSEYFQFLNPTNETNNYNNNNNSDKINNFYGNRGNEMILSTSSNNSRNDPVSKLGLLKKFQELPIEMNVDKLVELSQSVKDLLNRFFIPLAKMVFYLQLVCENVLLAGPDKLGQSVVDYCQKEVKNIILVRYNDHLNIASSSINTVNNTSNTMALVSIMNGINNLEEYFMIIDAVKVLEEYILKLNDKMKVDREVAEFQMFMKTLRDNKDYNQGMESENGSNDGNTKDKENDDWISYDTRLSETPQGSTVLALIWHYARIPFKKRNLQMFSQFTMNRYSNNNASYIPGCKVLERFIYLLNDWILNGNLVYPESDCGSQFDFFITDVLGYNSKLRNERLWEIKFNILKDGLDDMIKFVQPCLGDKTLLKKILDIGKLRHLYHIFISTSSNDVTLREKSLSELPILDLEIFEDRAKFQYFINKHYEDSNRLVLELFENKYKINKMIPDLISFYQCKNKETYYNLSTFLNNSLLDLTKYPTEFNLRSLQNSFQLLFKGYNNKNNDNEWINMVHLRFDELTVLEHINNFKLLQKDASSNVNGEDHRLEYEGNFQDFKRLVLPTVSTEAGSNDYPLDNMSLLRNPSKTNNNKLVSINFMKIQLEVPFPLSIILNKTVAMQLEMVQRKLLHYYYMEKIMMDIHLEINKNEFWIEATKDTRLNILGIKKLHYKMKFFTKYLQEYINNGVLAANDMPDIGSNGTLAEYVFELNNYLTNVMIKIWLTNSDISTCEYNVIQLIFQFCKFVTHLRHKLEQILESTEEDVEVEILINNIELKFRKYTRSFDEWLQLYIECVYAEFSKNSEGNNTIDIMNDKKGLNGVYLKKFLRDLEGVLTF
ncbi:hypothetical protein ACO0SA_002026 [Hanseniaspora valbyensis]